MLQDPMHVARQGGRSRQKAEQQLLCQGSQHPRGGEAAVKSRCPGCTAGSTRWHRETLSRTGAAPNRSWKTFLLVCGGQVTLGFRHYW